ncbi:MAG: hypothetical protein WC732_09375 [Candidatus Omnitrophota bacterium]
MAEELKALIDKIQKEGVEAAETSARQIQERAQEQAKETLRKAQAEAQRLLEDSRQKIRREEEAAQATLKQAGRDLVLSLKKEIHQILEKIVAQNVGASLKPEELAALIRVAVEQYGRKDAASVSVSLKPEDLSRLENAFLAKLEDELKKPIVLKASEELAAGFVISFDEGKSHFDFSDKALAGYLLETLRPLLARIALEEISS